MYIAVLSQFEAIPRKPQQDSLINIYGSFMIKCQIKHSMKLRRITEDI